MGDVQHLIENEQALLKAIRCLYEQGMLKETLCLASWYGDTFIREEIPPEVWLAMGGTLLPAGKEKMRRNKGKKRC